MFMNKKFYSICVLYVFWNIIFKKNFIGIISIKLIILKDGYNFIVYILDFKEGIEEIDVDEDMFLLVNEKVEFEKFEKDGKF